MSKNQANSSRSKFSFFKIFSFVFAFVLVASVVSVTVAAVAGAPVGEAYAESVYDEDDFHIYQQTDSRWGSYRYGTGSGSNNIHNKGCGILSTINAVEYLTGNFINPKVFADWAMKTGQYCKNVGSYNTITKNSVSKFGKKYGYELDEYYVFSSHVSVKSDGSPKTKSGMTSVWNHLVEKLSDGDTCVSLVKGHFIAIVDYDEDTNKVLVLDSAASVTRGTSALATASCNWKTMNQLWSGSSEGKAKLKLRQMFTFLKSSEDGDALFVEDAIEWAVNTANNNSCGYSTKTRNGPDYDCSSFICTAFNKAGFGVSASLSTKTMANAFKKADFEVLTKSQAGALQRGDILLKPGYSAELYLGDNKCVAAFGDYDRKRGDSSGREIQVRSKASTNLLKNKSYTYVIRY